MSQGGFVGGEPQRFAAGGGGPEYYVPLNAERSRRVLEEMGRKLASEREDLIAQGVDPTLLAVPLAPTDRPAQTEPDMTWRRANGTMGEYHGDLIELGMGIPRNLPSWGPRRALFDFAFGYVSGFPLRDVLPFALRSLFPSRPRPASELTVTEVTCDVPPPGWWCSRTGGHDGPCAAHPWRDDPRLGNGTPS